MKKTFKSFGIAAVLIAVIVTTAFAQAKLPKAKKILDPSVPIEQSAILYIPKGSTLFQCDDTIFGTITPITMKNLKGDGSAKVDYIAKPILQVPAGKHSITGVMNGTGYGPNRRITMNFLAGHYYQMVMYGKGDIGQVTKNLLKNSLTGVGYDWCFLDITEEVKAGQKKFDYTKYVKIRPVSSAHFFISGGFANSRGANSNNSLRPQKKRSGSGNGDKNRRIGETTGSPDRY